MRVFSWQLLVAEYLSELLVLLNSAIPREVDVCCHNNPLIHIPGSGVSGRSRHIPDLRAKGLTQVRPIAKNYTIQTGAVSLARAEIRSDVEFRAPLRHLIEAN
jgi:hypothetical protein